MLEIFAIVYLSKRISKMVSEKGLKSAKYVIIMILLWVGLEIVGVVLGNIFIGEGLAAYPMALLGAALGGTIGYHIAKNARPQMDAPDILDSNI